MTSRGIAVSAGLGLTLTLGIYSLMGGFVPPFTSSSPILTDPFIFQGDAGVPGNLSVGGVVASPTYLWSTPTTTAYYVDPAGSDTNACTSTGAAACATIAGARAKLPERLLGAYTITVAAGSYPTGAWFTGLTCAAPAGGVSGSLTVQGTLANSTTLATGTATGTASSATNAAAPAWGTLTDSTQTWTGNDLAGRFVTLTSGTGSGQRFVIASNTGTALTIQGRWTTAPDATTHYAIQDSATLITGPATDGTAPSFGNPLDSSIATQSAAFVLDPTPSTGTPEACITLRYFNLVNPIRGVHIAGGNVTVQWNQFSGASMLRAVQLIGGDNVLIRDNSQASNATTARFVQLYTGTRVGYLKLYSNYVAASSYGFGAGGTTAGLWLLNNTFNSSTHAVRLTAGENNVIQYDRYGGSPASCIRVPFNGVGYSPGGSMEIDGIQCNDPTQKFIQIAGPMVVRLDALAVASTGTNANNAAHYLLSDGAYMSVNGATNFTTGTELADIVFGSGDQFALTYAKTACWLQTIPNTVWSYTGTGCAFAPPLVFAGRDIYYGGGADFWGDVGLDAGLYVQGTSHLNDDLTVNGDGIFYPHTVRASLGLYDSVVVGGDVDAGSLSSQSWVRSETGFYTLNTNGLGAPAVANPDGGWLWLGGAGTSASALAVDGPAVARSVGSIDAGSLLLTGYGVRYPVVTEIVPCGSAQAPYGTHIRYVGSLGGEDWECSEFSAATCTGCWGPPANQTHDYNIEAPADPLGPATTAGTDWARLYTGSHYFSGDVAILTVIEPGTGADIAKGRLYAHNYADGGDTTILTFRMPCTAAIGTCGFSAPIIHPVTPASMGSCVAEVALSGLVPPFQEGGPLEAEWQPDGGQYTKFPIVNIAGIGRVIMLADGGGA